MNNDKLSSVAKTIVAKQKGVLAADESNPTIKKRFASIKVASTEENRRRYHKILFTTEGIERYIGGVILFNETLRQSTREGTPFAELLSSRGILPGIKVDKGSKALAFSPEEKIAEGLDGLRERLVEYKQMGSKFAKWRAVIEINERDVPTASVFVRMPTYWRVTPRFARNCLSSRSWNRKYSWMVPTTSNAAKLSYPGFSMQCSPSLMPTACCSRVCC